MAFKMKMAGVQGQDEAQKWLKEKNKVTNA